MNNSPSLDGERVGEGALTWHIDYTDTKHMGNGSLSRQGGATLRLWKMSRGIRSWPVPRFHPWDERLVQHSPRGEPRWSRPLHRPNR